MNMLRQKLSVLSCLLLLALSTPALAMTLQQAMQALQPAKEQGMVGEQPNGYLAAVTQSEDAVAIVKLINDARRAEYTRLARENNIGVAEVEAIAGQKAIERTQRGHFILLDGNWIQKR
ncbi:YdbL family protein [Arsukibacterium sp.]|uniref:YdbL family protein n=1 Tax=Arsukibacterium sp. TaxID=1977258 RepID=UPI002FD8CC3C